VILLNRTVRLIVRVLEGEEEGAVVDAVSLNVSRTRIGVLIAIDSSKGSAILETNHDHHATGARSPNNNTKMIIERGMDLRGIS